MQYAIIDEHFYHLVATPYKYLTIFMTKDQQGFDIIKFSVDVTNFTEEQKGQLYDVLRFFYQSTNENLLPITDSNEIKMENGVVIFECQCCVPVVSTVSSYYSRNKCLDKELKNHILNTVEIYKLMTSNQIPVEVSFDTMSVVPVHSKYPFPRLIISPYAAFKAFFNKLENKPVFVHKTFANLFKFFNVKIDEMVPPKQQKGIAKLLQKSVGIIKKNTFNDIISVLENENDVTELLNAHEYLKEAAKEMELPSMKIEELTFIKALGEGAFGAVCLVKKDGVEYAMKQSAEHVIGELYKEAFIMNDLDHRNIIKMNGYCVSKQNIVKEWVDGKNHGFMLMEACKCGDLEKYINSYKGTYMPHETVKLIFGQIADAIIYVHSKRYIHRDLKTPNILMAQTEPFPFIKLCDFGLATGNDSVISGVAGTPLTMDERILKGENYTDRADLFSVGCILYALMFKKYPGENCQNIPQLLNMMKEKAFDYNMQWGMDVEYEPMIELAKMLLEQDDKKLKQGERRDNEVFWTEFRKHKVVKECIEIAHKKLKYQK